MLVEPRNLTSAAEIAENTRKTRRYFKSLKPPPEPPSPPPPPAPKPPPEPVHPDWSSAAAEVVDAIVAKAGIQRPMILCSVVNPGAIEARRIAMAVCILHLQMPVDTAAVIFNVPREAAWRAVVDARRIYLGAAIPKGTLVYAVVSALVDSWPQVLASSLGMVNRIKRAVCVAFDVSLHDLESMQRHRTLAIARQAGMALSKRLTRMSVAEIARRFNRDHTTGLHACRKMDPYVEIAARGLSEDASLDDWAKAMRRALSAAYPHVDGERKENQADKNPLEGTE